MTDQEINIAIADECGEFPCNDCDPCLGGRPDQCAISRIKSYTTDLNAMHEAICSLNQNQRDRFATTLYAVANGGVNAEEAETHDFLEAAVNADCEQRAEAFLRTIGKWREG
jgi:hypothetical protein